MKYKEPKEDFQVILKSKGFKATPMRLRLMETLAKNRIPLGTKEILSSFPAPRPNEVTLYRALKDLSEAGVIARVDLRDDRAYYEYKGGHHHHIVCKKCRKIEDFADCNLAIVMQKAILKSKEFKTVNEHSLEFFGVCKVCERK